MKKSWFLLCLVVVLCEGCGSVSSQQGGGGTTSEQGVGRAPMTEVNIPLVQVPDTMHLGRVREGEIVAGSFAINNNGDSPLVIVDIRSTCGCSEVKYNTKPIMGGESREVEFFFDSKGRGGVQFKSFDVKFAGSESIMVHFDAEVITK